MKNRNERHARYLRRQAAFFAVEGILTQLPIDDALRVISDMLDSILVLKSAQDIQNGLEMYLRNGIFRLPCF